MSRTWTQVSELVRGSWVSSRPWRSRDSWRIRKKVLMARRDLSTSPQGSRLVKWIPVRGVPVGGRSREASDIRYSMRSWGFEACRCSSSNMSRKISSFCKVINERINRWMKGMHA